MGRMKKGSENDRLTIEVKSANHNSCRQLLCRCKQAYQQERPQKVLKEPLAHAISVTQLAVTSVATYRLCLQTAALQWFILRAHLVRTVDTYAS